MLNLLKELSNELGVARSITLGGFVVAGCYVALSAYVEEDRNWKTKTTAAITATQNRVTNIELKLQRTDAFMSHVERDRADFHNHKQIKWHSGAGEEIPALKARVSALERR